MFNVIRCMIIETNHKLIHCSFTNYKLSLPSFIRHPVSLTWTNFSIGNVINTAARLESYGKEIPEKFIDPYCQVMVAASTVEQLPDEFDLDSVGTLELKGKSQGVDVFALIGRR